MRIESILQKLWFASVLLILHFQGWKAALIYFIGGIVMWYVAYTEMKKKQDQLCELYENWIACLQKKLEK